MLQQDLSADVRAERTELAEVPDVVVADDGGWGSRRALEQAAREAERRRARLVVVTVVISSPVEPEGWAAWNRAERDAGDHARAVNAAAQRRVRDRRPRLAVQGVVTASGSDIAAVAERAGLLVLGRRGASGKGVFRMGTTSGDLVRQFRCPVLVCRDEQSRRPRSSAARSRNPEVVAAVHVPAETTTVLRRAVQEAELRAMPLCVFSSGGTPSTPFLETALAAEKSVPWRLVWTAGVVGCGDHTAVCGPGRPARPRQPGRRASRRSHDRVGDPGSLGRHAVRRDAGAAVMSAPRANRMATRPVDDVDSRRAMTGTATKQEHIRAPYGPTSCVTRLLAACSPEPEPFWR